MSTASQRLIWLCNELKAGNAFSPETLDGFIREAESAKLTYVATYGDMGLEVEHFTDNAQYEEAVKAAKTGWKRDDFDTYTHGDATP